MKNLLRFFLFSLMLILVNSCQQSSSNPPKSVSIPQVQPVTQLKALNAPDVYKYQPLKLTGNEVEYKQLKIETAANGQKIAKLNDALFTGATVYKMTNGGIFIYQNYSNGIKHGSYQLQKNGADDDGNPENVFETGVMNNGKLNGLQLTYYDGAGGPLKKASFYNQDKMNGQWSSYYRNGAQWTRRDFKNGILDGKVLVWGEDGLLGKEYTYSNGNLIKKINHFENR